MIRALTHLWMYVAFCVLCSGFALPTNLKAAKDGGVVSPLSAGVGVRALGLGGAYTTLADDAIATHWNPAGLVWLDRFSLSATHERFFEGTELNSLNWGGDFDEYGVFGGGFTGLSTDEFPAVSVWTPTGASINYSTARFTLSYARLATKRVGIGVSAHLLSEKLAADEDLGFGVDVGFSARVGELAFAAVGRNLIAPSMALANVSESLPRSLQFGIGGNRIEIIRNLRLSGALEVEATEDRSASLRVGAEAELVDRLQLRGGYDGDDPTFGAGFKFGDLRIDYALTILDIVQDSHRFGVNFAFGPGSEERESKRMARERLIGESFARHERAVRAQSEARVAQTFESDGALDSARAHYELARSLDSSAVANTKLEELSQAILAERRRAEAEALASSRQSESDAGGASVVSVAEALAEREAFRQALELLESASGADIDSARANIIAQRKKWRQEELSRARSNARAARPAEAFAGLSALLSEFPNDQSLQARVDSALEQAGRLDLLNEARGKLVAGELAKARTLCEAALALDSANVSALALRDSILNLSPTPDGLDELAQDTEAWRAFSEALRLVRAGEIKRADNILAELLKRYPNNQEILRNRRQIELRLQREE